MRWEEFQTDVSPTYTHRQIAETPLLLHYVLAFLCLLMLIPMACAAYAFLRKILLANLLKTQISLYKIRTQY